MSLDAEKPITSPNHIEHVEILDFDGSQEPLFGPKTTAAIKLLLGVDVNTQAGVMIAESVTRQDGFSLPNLITPTFQIPLGDKASAEAGLLSPGGADFFGIVKKLETGNPVIKLFDQDEVPNLLGVKLERETITIAGGDLGLATEFGYSFSNGLAGQISAEFSKQAGAWNLEARSALTAQLENGKGLAELGVLVSRQLEEGFIFGNKAKISAGVKTSYLLSGATDASTEIFAFGEYHEYITPNMSGIFNIHGEFTRNLATYGGTAGLLWDAPSFLGAEQGFSVGAGFTAQGGDKNKLNPALLFRRTF